MSQTPAEESLKKDEQKEATQSPRGTQGPAGPCSEGTGSTSCSRLWGTAARRKLTKQSPNPTDNERQPPFWPGLQGPPAAYSSAQEHRRERRDGDHNVSKGKEVQHVSILNQPQKQRGNLQFAFCWPDGTKCPLGLGGRLPAGSSQNWAHVLQGEQLQRGHKRNHGRAPHSGTLQAQTVLATSRFSLGHHL